MESKLNSFLSDLVVEYHKLQSFHWYVKGGDFFQVHAKLEEYYDEIRDLVDEVAELALIEGLCPVSRLSEFLERSQIEEAPGTFQNSGEVLDAVLADYCTLRDEAVALKREAEASGHELVAIKADGYIEYFSKAIWMIGQSR